MPERSDNPSARPVLKLRSVSMHEAPRQFPAAPNSPSIPAQAPRIPFNGAPSPSEIRASSSQGQAAGVTSRQDTGGTERPAFTWGQSESSSRQASPDAAVIPVLPRTRYRPAAASTGGATADRPPTPAVALRLRQGGTGCRPVAIRPATPLRLLHEAVRFRLWDVGLLWRPKQPPSG